jgi:hypothetical protein
MKYKSIFIVLSSALLLCGCGAKKKAVQQAEPKPVVPTWHTCLIQGAQATVVTDEDKLSSAVTMQTVHDSMIVISVTPMFGMEMMRVEATPTEIIAIDKLHGRYARGTFADLNKQLTPSLNWDILQQVCTAELPTGPEKARLVYTFGKKQIELILTYPPRKIDVPVRMTNQRLTKYTEIDVSKFL